MSWRDAAGQAADLAEKTYQELRVTEDAAIGTCAAALAACGEGTITEVTQRGDVVDDWVDDRRAVLEVSGIRTGSSEPLEDRHSEKQNQLTRSRLHQVLGYPGYVFVVAFGDHRAIFSYHLTAMRRKFGRQSRPR